MNDMDNSDRVRILEIIDQFRALGINEDISLPQVCMLWSLYSPQLILDSLSLLETSRVGSLHS